MRTLQLEMLYVYRALEEEALDIAAEELRTSGGSAGATLSREGSTTELQLLVAEFALLDEQLEALGAALKSAALSLADDDVLEQLAVEVPDLRYRVGVSDDTVFGSNPFSLSRLNLQAQESVGKVGARHCTVAAWGGSVGAPRPSAHSHHAHLTIKWHAHTCAGSSLVHAPQSRPPLLCSKPLTPPPPRPHPHQVFEGVNFLTRGLRLLGSDVGNATRLFMKAAIGGRLRAREVKPPCLTALLPELASWSSCLAAQQLLSRPAVISFASNLLPPSFPIAPVPFSHTRRMRGCLCFTHR